MPGQRVDDMCRIAGKRDKSVEEIMPKRRKSAVAAAVAPAPTPEAGGTG